MHLKTHSGEKTNKCNQCDFASSRADHLRTHLKTHSGEKSNKCNQCDYASFYATDLKTHLKAHSGENSNKCNQCDYASSYASALRTHLKTQWRKVKEMQPVWLCIFLCKCFEDPFENTQWRKVKQMQQTLENSQTFQASAGRLLFIRYGPNTKSTTDIFASNGQPRCPYSPCRVTISNQILYFSLSPSGGR